jgi:hypothetical protein
VLEDDDFVGFEEQGDAFGGSGELDVSAGQIEVG